MKKTLFIILSLLTLVGCRNVDLNPAWYPNGIGRDVLYVAKPDGKFYVAKGGDRYAFFVNTNHENGYSDPLLEQVDYFSYNDRLYVYSCKGYAVVDELANTAQVFLPSKTRYFTSHLTDDCAVTFLTSFDEFSKKDQEILSEMERIGGKNRKERKYGKEYVSIFGKLIPTN